MYTQATLYIVLQLYTPLNSTGVERTYLKVSNSNRGLYADLLQKIPNMKRSKLNPIIGELFYQFFAPRFSSRWNKLLKKVFLIYLPLMGTGILPTRIMWNCGERITAESRNNSKTFWNGLDCIEQKGNWILLLKLQPVVKVLDTLYRVLA